MSNSAEKTKNLRNYLELLFSSLDIISYFELADEKSETPYIVYYTRHISGVDDSDFSARYIMYIDAYGVNGSDELDDLLDLIEAYLSERVESNNFGTFAFFLNYNRQELHEEEPLKHKQTMIELQYFF